MNDFLGLLAVFGLVFTNGFFVAAEFALVGARRTRIAQLADEGHSGAKAAQNAIQHLDSYIAATQLGITLSSLALGWIGEPAIGHLIEPILVSIIPGEHAAVEALSLTISVAISFAIVTMLHIIMGELVPKSIALQRPEATSVIVARPVSWFLWVFRPVIHVMNGIGNFIVHRLGFEAAGEHSTVHSAAELEMLVQSSREAGMLQASEEKLLRAVFDFSEINAEEIMTPRVDVDGIEIDTPLPDILAYIQEHHHSRYPVYADSLDNVIGLLLVKDLLDALVRQPHSLTDGGATFPLRTLLRKPPFIPATVGVDKLMEAMQKAHTHMAIVLDEYGGTAGVVSLEDVIELLVGEVQDEFDSEPETDMQMQGDHTLVDGQVSLHDVMERFGEPEGEPESTTIGGYISEVLNRIPETGDRIHFAGYEVVVEVMDGLRVERVRFSPVLPENAGASVASADQPPSTGDS
ncbi:MAG: HlyC/CorC family transporter [Anaerolineae bacterium]|nr:HlyC/CorC family transporter [Anaerolineae bacterium]